MVKALDLKCKGCEFNPQYITKVKKFPWQSINLHLALRTHVRNGRGPGRMTKRPKSLCVLVIVMCPQSDHMVGKLPRCGDGAHCACQLVFSRYHRQESAAVSVIRAERVL